MLCAVSNSAWMVVTWQPVVIDLHLSTKLPQDAKSGEYYVTLNLRKILNYTNEKHHSVLQDDSALKEGDLYIRSVCFSPDGMYLATGAEDKKIRV